MITIFVCNILQKHYDCFACLFRLVNFAKIRLYMLSVFCGVKSRWILRELPRVVPVHKWKKGLRERERERERAGNRERKDERERDIPKNIALASKYLVNVVKEHLLVVQDLCRTKVCHLFSKSECRVLYFKSYRECL